MPIPLDEAWAIGIDVGGTKIAGGLVRFPAGELTCRHVIPTQPARGPEAVLASVATQANRLADQARSLGQPLVGVGIGVPELVNLNGEVTSGQTVDWRGISLGDRLAGLGRVHVEADVRAAALAEALFGAGRPYRLFAYVTVGTGISSTIIQDGRPYAGARGNALVLASAPMSSVCPSCGATARVALEEVASGPGLVSRYNRERSGAVLSAEDVLAAAAAGDNAATRIVHEAGEALGHAVAFLANVLDPEAVVVGGGLGLAGGAYWDAFVSSVRRHIWAETTRTLPILPAVLGTDAGLIGAAAGVWRHGPTA